VVGVSLASVVMAKWEKCYDPSKATYPLIPLAEDLELVAAK
jgi:hypothetical protein